MPRLTPYTSFLGLLIQTDWHIFPFDYCLTRHALVSTSPAVTVSVLTRHNAISSQIDLRPNCPAAEPSVNPFLTFTKLLKSCERVCLTTAAPVIFNCHLTNVLTNYLTNQLTNRLYSEVVYILYTPQIRSLRTPPNIDFASQDNNKLKTTHYLKRLDSLNFIPTTGAVLWTALHCPQHYSPGWSSWTSTHWSAASASAVRIGSIARRHNAVPPPAVLNRQQCSGKMVTGRFALEQFLETMAKLLDKDSKDNGTTYLVQYW